MTDEPRGCYNPNRMLKLHNTLSRRKDAFKPIKKSVVRLYTCGPTVYDRAHIGNLRTYIFEDILRRTLKYDGYRVKQIMNITDVEDKIIKRFKREKKKDIHEITKPYTKAFFEDIGKLNIEKAEGYPTVTGNIREIIRLIRRLEKRGFAYRGRDGSIYFDISKFKDYGRLARIKKVNLKSGVRVSADEYEKGDIGDFVLWKKKKKGEPSWKSPFGEGRPGWHIECSAIGMKHLGGSFDIHTGGVDNIFPHHDNEIAQSEGATGEKFVNYWVHGEHLIVDGRKMSKSLKNFYTLEDLEDKGFNPISFRYLMLTAHYRSKLNFTWRAMESASRALNNIYREMAYINIIMKGDKEKRGVRKTAGYEKSFMEALNDDLNTPKALSVMWSVVRDKGLSAGIKKELLMKFDKVLGLNLKVAESFLNIPEKIDQLVHHRENLRSHKQFIQADALRKRVEDLGYTIEDTEKGPFVWPKRM